MEEICSILMGLKALLHLHYNISPCVKCINMVSPNKQKIREDMFFYEINQSYHQWYSHVDFVSSRSSTSRAEHHNRFPFSNVHSMIEWFKLHMMIVKITQKRLKHFLTMLKNLYILAIKFLQSCLH